MANSRKPEKSPGEGRQRRAATGAAGGPSHTREPPNLPGTVRPFKAGARAYRRPLPPAPIEPYEIRHPAVPESLDGLTILHVTDLHVRRKRPIGFGLRRAAEALAATPADLVLLTGDYMDLPGDEGAALGVLEFLAGAWHARHGAYAIFGNHDSWAFRREAARVCGIRWLVGRGTSVSPIAGLTLVGFNEPEDVLGTVLEGPAAGAPCTGEGAGEAGRFYIALAHYPSEIYTIADLGIPLVLAGHTHGGQWRLSPSLAPHTSTDLPPHLASGLLRLKGSLCAISRGLGYAAVEFRFNCPAHIPLYTLRRAEFAPAGKGSTGLVCAAPW